MLKKIDNYEHLMNEIKEMNHEYKKIVFSKKYQIVDVINKIIKREVGIKYIKNRFLSLCAEVKCKCCIGTIPESEYAAKKEKSNYYFPHRIAVYTCICGNYDKIQEPFVVPDNCDFYLFCTKECEVNSDIWQKRDIDTIALIDKKWSLVEKSRFVKMCPHILFPEYEYSFYIDANAKIMTDVSEFMHNIGETGISMHKHSRGCVYKEAKAVLYYHKATRQKIEQYIRFLKKNKMPREYGLLAGNTIARCHHNDMCVQIMEEWWQMFLKYVQRDQLLLPYVLFKHDIKVEEIATMYGEYDKNDALLWFKHIE